MKKIVRAFTGVGVCISVLFLLDVSSAFSFRSIPVEFLADVLMLPLLPHLMLLIIACGFWDDNGILPSKICTDQEILIAFAIALLSVFFYYLLGFAVALFWEGARKLVKGFRSKD